MSPSLSSLGEFGLIQHLKKQLGKISDKNILMGIGDDCAVLRSTSQRYQLLTHDLLLEGVHFIRGGPGDFENLGYKALAVNLSDIAAMGGTAAGAVIGLGLAPKVQREEVEALYRGFKQGAKQFSCAIVGGDTNLSMRDWVVAVSVLGFCDRRPLLRRGAKAGDTLWVTGTLGGPRLGWESIQRGDSSSLTRPFRLQHARPTPRLDWGREFLLSGLVSSMIDVSDGLAGDLAHLSEASEVGFEVEFPRIPRHPSFERACLSLKLSPQKILIEGGEDYELLFTVKRGKDREFSKFLTKKKIRAAFIGVANQGRSVSYMKSKKKIQQSFQSFKHF